MLEIAGGDLDRSAAFDRKHEDVVVSEVEIADPVLFALEAVLHDRRVGPFRPGGWFRRGNQARRRVGDQFVEGEVAAVRGPPDVPWRFEELGETGGFTGVHPAQVDLAIRDVGDPGAVR